MKVSIDYSMLENVPISELIAQDGAKSDQETPNTSDVDSVKSEDNLSDEEFKNHYSFLESFKKKRSKHRKHPKKIPQPPLMEEKYTSD